MSQFGGFVLSDDFVDLAELQEELVVWHGGAFTIGFGLRIEIFYDWQSRWQWETSARDHRWQIQILRRLIDLLYLRWVHIWSHCLFRSRCCWWSSFRDTWGHMPLWMILHFCSLIIVTLQKSLVCLLCLRPQWFQQRLLRSRYWYFAFFTPSNWTMSRYRRGLRQILLWWDLIRTEEASLHRYAERRNFFSFINLLILPLCLFWLRTILLPKACRCILLILILSSILHSTPWWYISALVLLCFYMSQFISSFVQVQACRPDPLVILGWGL